MSDTSNLIGLSMAADDIHILAWAGQVVLLERCSTDPEEREMVAESALIILKQIDTMATTLRQGINAFEDQCRQQESSR